MFRVTTKIPTFSTNSRSAVRLGSIRTQNFAILKSKWRIPTLQQTIRQTRFTKSSQLTTLTAIMFQDGKALLDEAATQLNTIRDFFRLTLSLFAEAQVAVGQGFNTPTEEAIGLILGVLKLSGVTHEPQLLLDSKLTRSEIQRIVDALKKRVISHTPTAYILNRATFGDFSFYVDERVLIPRSLLAELLVDDEQKLSHWYRKSPENVQTCLDLCTGSGCLAVHLAYVFPNAKVDAVDISEEALQVAAMNVKAHDLEDRVNLIQSDMFHNLQGRKYDVIISNPPYVTAEAMENLPEEFKREPSLALFGGKDGLDFTRKILKHAQEHLHEEGLLMVETGRDQRQALEAEYSNLSFNWVTTSVSHDDVFILTNTSFLRKPFFPTKRAG